MENSGINSDVVRDILRYNLISKDYISDKYVIIIDNCIFCCSGKFTFDSKEQATKAFYNAISWKAKRELYAREHNGNSIGWYSSDSTSRLWRVFKRALVDEYGFKIVRLNGQD